mmetsp:Transcript_77695/g.222695  ORF Transcript_77695/g.222695 Transcript_77695/m.222695 type:complete len:273 (+) Transcript_77695:169-987(+)
MPELRQLCSSSPDDLLGGKTGRGTTLLLRGPGGQLLDAGLDLLHLLVQPLHSSPSVLPAPRAEAPGPGRQQPPGQGPQGPEHDAIAAVVATEGLEGRHRGVARAPVDHLQAPSGQHVPARRHASAAHEEEHADPQVVHEEAIPVGRHEGPVVGRQFVHEALAERHRDDVGALRHHHAAEEIRKIRRDVVLTLRALRLQQIAKSMRRVFVVVIQDHEHIVGARTRVGGEPVQRTEDLRAWPEILLHPMNLHPRMFPQHLEKRGRQLVPSTLSP